MRPELDTAYLYTDPSRNNDVELKDAGVDPLGYVRGTGHDEGITGPNRVKSPDDPRFTSLPAAKKQELLWQALKAEPYAELPALGSAGLGGGKNLWQKIVNTLKIFSRAVLRATFDKRADVRPARDKLFHPFGTTARVRYEPVAGQPYTGLFASGAPGIMRLSLANTDKAYVPATALKLFVDGQPSANALAIPKLDPQESKDFFEFPMRTALPKPKNFALKCFAAIQEKVSGIEEPLRLPVDHFATQSTTGREIGSPKAPYEILFQTAGPHFDPNTTTDFRDELAATFKAGDHVLKVMAKATKDSPAQHIGNIVLESDLVASDYSDRRLHFWHPK